MSKKKTIVELYNELLANYDLSKEHIDFINERIAITDKKNSNRKPTAKQLTNQNIANAICDFMSENPNTLYQIRDLMKNVPALAEIPDLSNQYTTSLVTSLRKLGKVERTESKGVAYYKYIG